jgi:hypothetical protein
VAVIVVDALEAVQIHEHQRQWAACAPRAVGLLVEQRVERAAV